MWIKKIATSIYVSIFVRMAFSAILCLSLFFILIFLSNSYIEQRNSDFFVRQQEEIDVLLEDIKNTISDKSLTYQEAKRTKFVNDKSVYNVYFLDISNELVKELNTFFNFDFLNNEHLYEISFADTDGFIVIKSNKVTNATNFLYISSSVFCIILFFVLCIYLIFRQLSYLKTIEKGIDFIADNNILYKIPIKGDDELARLAMSINSMGNSLYNKRQKEREDEINQRLLITNMSHDLKTPLTSINGYIDIAKNKLSEDDEVYQYICIAKENGARLEKLVNDLFLYSKIISGDMPIELRNININIMLKQILEIRTENIISNIEKKDLIANIDAEKFHRVMDNLISNAKKYGIKDKPINVLAYLKDKDIVIEVKNYTNDKLNDNLEILKNRLYTAREYRTNGSSGLGLSIVTELLNMMNGSLELSFYDKIFTAKITLPKI